MTCIKRLRDLDLTRFELFMIFGIYGTCYILRGSSLLFPTFANVTPEWRCGTEGPFSRNCSLIQECGQNITYRSSFYSARQEFGLICDRAYIAAMVSSIQFVGVVAGANVLGQLSDIYGRRWIVLIVLCGEITFGLGSSFASCYISLGILRFLAGFFSGGTLVVITVYVVESIKPQQRIFMFAFVSWPVVQTILTGIAYYTDSWRWYLRCCAIGGSISPLIVLGIAPESLKWAKDRGKHELATKIIGKINRINGRTTADNNEAEFDYLKQPPASDSIPAAPGYINQKGKYAIKDLVANRQMTILTIVMCVLWPTVALTSYTIYFDSRNLGGNFYANQILLAFFYFAANMTVFIVDTYVPKFNRRILHQGPQLMVAILTGVIAILLAVGLEGRSRLAVTYLAVITTYFAAFIWDAVYLCTAELFPTEVRGTAFGVCNFFARCAIILAPQTVLLREIWEASPYLIMSVVGFIAFAVSCKFLPDTKNRELPSNVKDVTDLTPH